MNKYIYIICMLFLCFGVYAQETIEVTGVVNDATSGETLPGVSVIVKDVAGLGSITDINGKFRIRMKINQTLSFSFLGYDKVEVLITEATELNITMNESDGSMIEELVVTSTGTQKRATVTGAITTVNVNELRVNPSGAISNSLAGNVPGVMSMQTSGRPGSASEFWIRGISTFGAGTAALVLVDGFERNMDEINVEDIESFSVLKDASATAIYGSRGANGVVLIQTKRGKSGKINIDVKHETSYNMLTKVPKFVDGNRYAQMQNEARITRNQDPIWQPDELDLLRLGMDPDLYPNVDWQELLLRKGAWTNRSSFNMSGGGSTARYYVSGSFLDQQGMYKTDATIRDEYNTNANYRRWNYRLNTDIDITKTTILKVGVSGSLEKYNDPGLGSDYFWDSLIDYNPVLTPVLYSNGYVPAFGTGNQTNPWVMATQTGFREHWKNNIQTSVVLEQNFDFITEGLRFVGRFGYDTNNENRINRMKWPEQWKAQRFRDRNGDIRYDRISTESQMHQESWAGGWRNEFFESEFHYDRSFGGHGLGGTLKYFQSSKIRTVDIGTDIKNGVARRNQGVAGRITYRWHLRYFLEFNYGYTGSENFAPGHKFGFFPAISGAWNIADEMFVKNNAEWINMLKIRYSWGRVGNDNLGKDQYDVDIRFPYLYDINTTNGAQFADIGFDKWYNGLRYTQVSSPQVTWEIATKNNLGFDISVFDNSFSTTVDFFEETREGIYLERRFLPAMVGLESNPRANVGKVKSRGVDGNVAVRQKLFDQVDFTLRANMTLSRNEVIERDEEERAYYYLMDKGHRVDQARGLISLGLFEDWDDIRNSPLQQFNGYNVMPGDIKYKDVNGDGIINDDDRVAVGATTKPNLIYGLGASIVWKGFDVNVHFQGAGKTTFFIEGSTVYMFSNQNGWGNVLTEMANSDRWIDSSISGTTATENPNAVYPRLSWGWNDNNYRASTFWLRNKAYTRLKTLEIGYTLPKNTINRVYMQNLRVFFIGTNLFTWSSFKLWDPELGKSNGTEYPLARTFLFGLTIVL